jgi:hypothetical protein
MNWNYRLLAMRRTRPADNLECWYAIHRVYYDKDNKAISGVSTVPATPEGENLEDVRKQLQLMLQAFERPILSFENFPEEHEEGDAQQNYINQ